jgi:hypothetical protein
MTVGDVGGALMLKLCPDSAGQFVERTIQEVLGEQNSEICVTRFTSPELVGADKD